MEHPAATSVPPDTSVPTGTSVPPDMVETALGNFTALLHDADFSAELTLMGIGRMQVLRRRQMLVEMRGLYMALWRLALASSFPQDAGHIFNIFLRRYGHAHKDKASVHALTRAREYWGMIEPRGNSDFSEVARHLSSFFTQDEEKARRMNLKLVLHIRKFYKLIFDRLI